LLEIKIKFYRFKINNKKSLPMDENSTLFYIYDNTNNEEVAEIEGKILNKEIKAILNWSSFKDHSPSKNLTKQIVRKVMQR